MVRRIVDIGSVLAVFLLVWTVGASAQTPATQPTDPTANSPAGAMYAIPLDSARQDAAPHGHSGGQAGGAGGSSGSSGGGSGSAATGSDASAGGASASGSGTSSASGTQGGTGSSGKSGQPPVLVPGGQPGSLIHSSEGFGASPVVPGTPGSVTGGLAAVQSDSSSAPMTAILLAVIVLAIGGYAGARAWRTGARRPSARSS